LISIFLHSLTFGARYLGRAAKGGFGKESHARALVSRENRRSTMTMRFQGRRPAIVWARAALPLLLACLLASSAAARHTHNQSSKAASKADHAGSSKLDRETVAKAEFSGKQPSEGKISALGLRLQVLLAWAHFSPGEIDGKFGENARKALQAYCDAQDLSSCDRLTQDAWSKLAADERPVLTDYRISDQDLAGPFLKRIPAKMEEEKDLPNLGYTSPREELAEKFHMSEDLLAALNPGETFDEAGHNILVVDPGEDGDAPKAARVEVDKDRQTVKVFGADDHLVDFYPATVGSEEKPSPTGKLRVTEIQRQPTYHYNPKYHFKGVQATSPFTIKAGPNNPVGSVWIGLSEEGYGIHGTPDPSKPLTL
jgi:lipoprotein-anchoring transpeptidase ErfK/SrfK